MATEASAVPAADGDPTDLLVRKLRVRDLVGEREERVLRAAIGRTETHPAGRVLVRPGATLSESILLVDGLVARYKDLSEGQRQIFEIHVAGDFLDLHGLLLKRLAHAVGTLTRATVAYVSHEALRRITEEEPHLSRMLWLSTMIDAAIQREPLLSVGRRTAAERLAHLVCELYVRLDSVGLTDGLAFSLPLTQADLADATGLTSVHVNRMLKRLRDGGFMTLRASEVVIHDWDRLQRLAEFDAAYLYTERRPR